MIRVNQPGALELRNRVVSVFRDVLDDQTLTPALSVRDDLDSLDRVTLILALEDEFNISISESTAKGFITLDDLTAFVENETRQGSPS